MSASVPVSSIRVGERHRKEFGDLDALAQSIREVGLLQPIGVTRDGDLVFGERRLRACRDVLGLTEVDARIVDVPSISAGEWHENEVRLDFTPSERVAILQTIERHQHGGDRKSDQRQEIALDRTKAAKLAGFGNRETARQATRVVEHGTPELVAAMDAGEVSISAAAEIARLPQPEQAQRLHHRTQGTGDNEWYTPPEYVEAARAVLGAIDVHPATSEQAQRIIRAKTFHTAEDDGLKHEWHGRVWLNPPYAQPLIAHFVNKLLVE